MRVRVAGHVAIPNKLQMSERKILWNTKFKFDLRDRRIKQTKINQNRKKTTNENITNHKIEHIIYMKMNLASI